MAFTRKAFPFLTFLACFSALPGCRPSEPTPPPGAASAPARGGELVASIRSEPATYNRFVAAGAAAATDVVTFLTQATLVRVNRATDELEPWLAEGWTASADGLTYTIALKQGLVFSDGAPMTSADVLFSFRAAYDPGVASPLASVLHVHGKPLVVSAPDARTVVIRFPGPFAPGLRVLDSLPIVPRHILEPALDAGQFQNAWLPSKPVTDVVGLGPFTLVEHVAGQRFVFARNPRYFRRDAAGIQLPYLDRLTMAVVPDQNTEALRLEASEIDLMSNGDIRPQDHSAFKQLADQGRLRMMEVSVALDPDFLSFNLRPAGPAVRRPAWIARKEFRQAISCGVDRQAIVNTVYLGAAAPLYGPITPGNRRWHSAAAPACTFDRERALKLLTTAGLADPQRRRHARGRRRPPGAVLDHHAGGQPARERVVGRPGTAPQARHRGRHRPARSARDLSAVDGGRLRGHLFRAAGELDGPGAQPGLLAELGALAFLEPGAEEPRDAVGTAHRRADAPAVVCRRSGRAPARVRGGAADHGGRAAVDLLRRGSRDARHVAASRQPHARPEAPPPALERGYAGGDTEVEATCLLLAFCQHLSVCRGAPPPRRCQRSLRSRRWLQATACSYGRPSPVQAGAKSFLSSWSSAALRESDSRSTARRTDRSGRLTIDEFVIDRIDDVSDPMLDYFGSIGGYIGGGIRGMGVLGDQPFTVKLELNEWFRFDKPGRYTLAVKSRRVTDESVTPHAVVPVESNTVSFEILPRDATWEASALDSARRIIDAKQPPPARAPAAG